MTGTIRVERSTHVDIESLVLWLSQHRGSTVDLFGSGNGRRPRLTLGISMSAARAVICPMVLDEEESGGQPERPLLVGTVSVVLGGRPGLPHRLTFTGRSSAQGSRGDAQVAAAHLLEAIESRVLEGRRAAVA